MPIINSLIGFRITKIGSIRIQLPSSIKSEEKERKKKKKNKLKNGSFTQIAVLGELFIIVLWNHLVNLYVADLIDPNGDM